MSPYEIGARWRCEPTDGSASFDFVVIGKGSRPDRKRCRLEYDNAGQPAHGVEQEYTHKHLKKYAGFVGLPRPAAAPRALTEVETKLLIGQLDFLRKEARLIWKQTQDPDSVLSMQPLSTRASALVERSRDVSNALLSALRIFGVRGLPEPLVLKGS